MHATATGEGAQARPGPGSSDGITAYRTSAVTAPPAPMARKILPAAIVAGNPPSHSSVTAMTAPGMVLNIQAFWCASTWRTQVAQYGNSTCSVGSLAPVAMATASLESGRVTETGRSTEAAPKQQTQCSGTWTSGPATSTRTSAIGGGPNRSKSRGRRSGREGAPATP